MVKTVLTRNIFAVLQVFVHATFFILQSLYKAFEKVLVNNLTRLQKKPVLGQICSPLLM